MAPPHPTSLWQDRPTSHGEHPWMEAPAVTPPPPPAPPPPPPPRGPGRLRRAAGLLLIALVAVLASAATVLVLDRTGGAGSSTTKAGSVKPLPAAGGRASSTRINEIYERVSAAVVSIRVGESGGRGASGTGFVIDTDGTLVTNAHVVDGASTVQVIFDDKRTGVDARVVGTDTSSDLAVLKVDPAKAPPLVSLPFADSDQVSVGDAAIAIGYPLGLDRTATAGIISGLGREIQAPNGYTIDKVIQTDAPINPGNSGGPLLDDRGRVIGVNSQIATAGSNGNVGIGFAVPSNTVREVIPRLKRGETVQRPYLGVSTAPSSGTAGAAVATINPGGPAEQAGLRPGGSITGQGGDVIVGIDGEKVSGPEDVARLVGARRPGDLVSVEIVRDGDRKTIDVELGVRPDRLAP